MNSAKATDNWSVEKADDDRIKLTLRRGGKSASILLAREEVEDLTVGILQAVRKLRKRKKG